MPSWYFAGYERFRGAVFTGPSGDDLAPPQGRLTLQTLTPVMTTTQSGKTTLYYTPYQGNLVPIYDGVSFGMTSIGTEISALTTDTTKSPAAIGASKVNDWFVWNDAGTIRLSHGPDWTSDTARDVTALLVMTNGILINFNAITNGPGASRGTYVGTTRSNASSQLNWIYGAKAAGGTAGFFGVWNTYNRISINTVVSDTTDSWVTVAGTTQAANNSATMRVTFVTGLAEDWFDAQYAGAAQSTGAGAVLNGVGYDTTAAMTGYFCPASNTSTIVVVTAGGDTQQPFGVHFFSAVEQANALNGNFFGDAGVPTLYQNGLMFRGRF